MNWPASAERYSAGDWIEDRFLVEAVHKGGMGCVYLCQDHKKQVPVALKTFERRYFDTVEARESFIEEACTWIELDRHPNIVEAKEILLIDGKPYLLLERIVSQSIRGATLKDHLYSAIVNEQEIIQIAVHICDGMLYALHKFPALVHRDLKTENILMDQEGMPKISDFGITQVQSLQENAPAPDNTDRLNLRRMALNMVGSPAYVSPEQCMGNPLDTRADIYSFGCILYALAVKSLPFHRATVEETIHAQLNEEPIPPVARNSEIHPRLSDLIMCCLQKDRENRYRNFEEIRDELFHLYFDFYRTEPMSYVHGSPMSAIDHIERGHSFAKLERWERAEREAQKALILESENIDAQFLYGDMLNEQGRCLEALDLFEAILNKAPDQTHALERKADILFRLGRSQEAIQSYEKVVQSDPSRWPCYLRLSEIMKSGHDYSQAEKYLQTGLKRVNNLMPLYRALAHLYREIGRKKNERDTLVKLLEKNQSDLDARIRLAELYNELGNRHGAMRTARAILQDDPDDGEIFFRLAKIFNRWRRRHEYNQALHRASQKGYESPTFWAEYANLLYEQGDLSSAWVFVTRAEEHGENVDGLKRKLQIVQLRNARGT